MAQAFQAGHVDLQRIGLLATRLDRGEQQVGSSVFAKHLLPVDKGTRRTPQATVQPGQDDVGVARGRVDPVVDTHQRVEGRQGPLQPSGAG